MDFLVNLASGFAVALSPMNLLYALAGAIIGTAIGVLPGLGPPATIALLLPVTYGMDATSAVIMDKLLEFLVNFLLLGVGVWAVVRVGLLSESGTSLTLSLIGLAGVLMWPAIHILLLVRGKYPIAALLRRQPFVPQTNRGLRLIIVSERMAAAFCRRHLRAMSLAILASALALAGIVLEYVLMIQFLGMQLSGVQIFAALTAMQLAFLMPLPGGLGALEASQVFALGAFGVDAASAIGLTLIIRARDILVGGIGLLLAGRDVTK